MTLTGIAARNILRNRRRTILNAIALALGCAMMVFGIGWIRGYINGIYERMIAFDTGHIQIHGRGYREAARRLPLDVSVPEWETTAKRVAQVPGVTAVTPRTDFAVKVSFRGQSVWLQGRGIDYGREAGVTTLKDNVTQGTYGGGLLLGKSLADRLGLSVGDTVFLTARDRYGNANLTDITVTGLFDFGYDPLDRYLAFMPIEEAASFLGMGDSVTRLVVRLKRTALLGRDLPLVQAAAGEGLDVRGWEDFAQVMLAATRSDIGGFYVTVGIIYLLVFLGILNSMSMAVFERTREIGTLRAIGMRRIDIRRLFVLEGVSVGFFASLAGCVIVTPLLLYTQLHGWDLAAYLPKDTPIPFGSVMRSDFRPWDLLAGTAVTVTAAALGSLMPAWRASKLTVAGAFSSVTG